MWGRVFIIGCRASYLAGQEVRVDTEYSQQHQVVNETLQGSVCSPLLSNIMIKDIFEKEI